MPCPQLCSSPFMSFLFADILLTSLQNSAEVRRSKEMANHFFDSCDIEFPMPILTNQLFLQQVRGRILVKWWKVCYFSTSNGIIRHQLYILIAYVVGGFNPIEKYWSNWIISPGRGEKKKCLKPPPSDSLYDELCK